MPVKSNKLTKDKSERRRKVEDLAMRPPITTDETRLKEVEVFARSLRSWNGQPTNEAEYILELVALVRTIRDTT